MLIYLLGGILYTSKGQGKQNLFIDLFQHPVIQLVKNLPAMWKTWVRSLGWEDHLEKEKAIQSSVLAWRIPWTTVPGVAECEPPSLSTSEECNMLLSS